MKCPNVRIYKITLLLFKIIPMLLTLCCVINTGLMIVGIDAPVFTFLGGTSVFVILLLYLISFTFRFCIYHRMFLHYIVLNNTLCALDLYNVIRVNDLTYIMLHIVLLGLTLFLILYFYQLKKHTHAELNKATAITNN